MTTATSSNTITITTTESYYGYGIMTINDILMYSPIPIISPMLLSPNKRGGGVVTIAVAVAIMTNNYVRLKLIQGTVLAY